MSIEQDLRIGIRKQVIANLNVQNLIVDHFYPSELNEVTNPEYPCANFSLGVGAKDPDTDTITWIPFRVWVWSELSKDETFNVYDKIRIVLHREVFDQSSIRFFCKETRTPAEAYDPQSKLYYVLAGWQARLITL